MGATRPRRTRDSTRQGWYARWRSFRFARHLGFPSTASGAPWPGALPLRRSEGLPALPRHGAAVRPCA